MSDSVYAGSASASGILCVRRRHRIHSLMFIIWQIHVDSRLVIERFPSETWPWLNEDERRHCTLTLSPVLSYSHLVPNASYFPDT